MRKIPIDEVFMTERLRLPAVSKEDVELVWEVSRIPGFNDGMTWDPPEDKKSILRTAESHIRNWVEGKEYNFTIELRGTNEPIGRVGIHRTAHGAVWSLGFWIHPDHWGKGYEAEGSRRVMELCFKRLGAKTIISSHAKWNSQSQRVMEKLSFARVGENPCGFYKNGRPVEEYEYEMQEMQQRR